MTSENLLREAQDPATPATRLQELAGLDRSLWPAIAANPSAYPGLLDWLGQQGDPAVTAAIAARSAAPTTPLAPPTAPLSPPAAPTVPFSAPSAAQPPYGSNPSVPGAPANPYAPGGAPANPYAPGGAPANPYAPNPYATGAYAPAPKKTSTGLIVGIVVAAVLVVGGAGVGIAWAAGAFNGGEETATETTTSEETSEEETTEETTSPDDVALAECSMILDEMVPIATRLQEGIADFQSDPQYALTTMREIEVQLQDITDELTAPAVLAAMQDTMAKFGVFLDQFEGIINGTFTDQAAFIESSDAMEDAFSNIDVVCADAY